MLSSLDIPKSLTALFIFNQDNTSQTIPMWVL